MDILELGVPVVILPTLLPPNSANHKLPSGPAVIPNGALPTVGMGYSEITPDGVILLTLLPVKLLSTNHKLPSAAAAMPRASLPGVGITNSVITPAGVIRPTLFALDSVNQRLPSWPVVIAKG